MYSRAQTGGTGDVQSFRGGATARRFHRGWLQRGRQVAEFVQIPGPRLNAQIGAVADRPVNIDHALRRSEECIFQRNHIVRAVVIHMYDAIDRHQLRIGGFLRNGSFEHQVGTRLQRLHAARPEGFRNSINAAGHRHVFELCRS